MTKIKICGLRDPKLAALAAEQGAAMLGFVFFDKSPRHINLDQAATLRALLPKHVDIVALCVNPDDDEIQPIVETLKPDWLQLHGQESPKRLQEIKARFHLPLIKALPVANKADVEAHKNFDAAELILFDGKADPLVRKENRPGGLGRSFEWSLLQNHKPNRPWMLAGGLDENNVTRAIRTLNPDFVDVSSSLETSPGEKNAHKMCAFMSKARAANQNDLNGKLDLKGTLANK